RVGVALAEVVRRQDLAFLACLDDVAPARAGEVDAAVGRGDGAGARRDPRQLLLVDQLAVGHLVAAEQVVVAGAVQELADDDARAARRRRHFHLPFGVRLAHVALAGRIYRRPRATAAPRIDVDQAAAEHRPRQP